MKHNPWWARSALCLALCVPLASADPTAQVPKDKARVYIIAPADGARVSSPVRVQFGLQGMGVAPAGIERAGTGHHHLLVDHAALPPAGVPMGADVHHFGAGQTETSLLLSPGRHRLQLVLGDAHHRPFEPSLVSEPVEIWVE